MPISKGFGNVFLKDILKDTTEEEMLSHYLGINEIPCRISAPYRSDSNPSLCIYNNNGKIRFIDFGTGDKGGIIDLLMKVWNKTFRECVEIISKDIIPHKDITETTLVHQSNHPHHTHTKSDIKVKVRNWKQYDIDFWESYGISLPWLKFGDVYPISRIFYISDTTKDFAAEQYAYAYVERKDGIPTIKIYQPKSTQMKWISKHDASVWDLWSKIPETGERLIINSSRKDALCVWENTGIPCVSMQGEGYIPKEHVINELKQRFNRVYILYDNDFQADENHGRKFSMELSKRFGISRLEIPDCYKSKDPSDLCLNYGRDMVRKVINQLIEQEESKSPF